MRLTKKKVLVTALAVCLAAILSMGSLAWFTDDDSVSNRFTIARSDDPDSPDNIFSVDVWEYVDGDTETKDQDGNTYENIVPGGRYHKEPYVENTGAYDQWIRVKISLSDAGAWGDIAAKYEITDLAAIFEGHDETAWTFGGSTNEGDILTYTYYLNYRLEPGETACVFNTVVIPEEITQEDAATLGPDFGLDIVAEAVQADMTGDDAMEGFATVEGAVAP